MSLKCLSYFPFPIEGKFTVVLVAYFFYLSID